MVEMLTVWMFSKMLLSSIMALFISLSLMALFSTTMVQIASSCSGVKRGLQSYVEKKYCNAKHKIEKEKMSLFQVYLLNIVKCKGNTVILY